MLCSNSCMSGRKWAWPRSSCTSVTSTAQNVLTVVSPETPTVPGMVSPVPDIILLECTLRGNHTHTHTHIPTHGDKRLLHFVAEVFSCYQHFTPIRAPVAAEHLTLNVTWLWGCLIKSMSEYPGDMAATCYAIPWSVCSERHPSSFPFSCFPPPPSFPTPALPQQHMLKMTFSASPAPITADDSGGRMFAMATPSSCAMGCKLMVSA